VVQSVRVARGPMVRLVVLLVLLVPLLTVVPEPGAGNQRPGGALPRLHPPQPTQPGPLGMPDVVLVVTDDQRVESLAPMTQVQDLLVARGTTYTEAMVPTSMCCPSRASLLTGRYAHQTGVWSNWGPTGGWWRFHEDGNEQHTLAVALDDKGYRTALIGKYLNNFSNSAPAGYRPPGWDVFTAFTTTERTGDYYNYSLSDGTVHGSARPTTPPTCSPTGRSSSSGRPRRRPGCSSTSPPTRRTLPSSPRRGT